MTMVDRSQRVGQQASHVRIGVHQEVVVGAVAPAVLVEERVAEQSAADAGDRSGAVGDGDQG